MFLKNIQKGIEIGLGFILVLVVFFGMIYAAGFHNPREILEGTFIGNYSFQGKVDVNGTLNAPNIDSNIMTAMYAGASASTTNSYLVFENGFFDSFNDELGIDNDSSTNHVFNSIGYYSTAGSNTGTVSSTNIFYELSPTLTASSVWTSNSVSYLDPIKDGSIAGGGFHTSAQGLTHWFQAQFSSAKSIQGYRWYVQNAVPASVSQIVFAGSNSGSFSGEQTTIDTWSTPGMPNPGWSSTRIFSNANSYLYYRWTITNGGGFTNYYFNGLGEVETFEGGASNISLVSKNYTANFEPTKLKLTIMEQNVDSVTINTDLVAYVSADGGTNWDQVTLSDVGNVSSTVRKLEGEVTISNSGTNIRYNLTTHNTKELKLHGVGMTWS